MRWQPDWKCGDTGEGRLLGQGCPVRAAQREGAIVGGRGLPGRGRGLRVAANPGRLLRSVGVADWVWELPGRYAARCGALCCHSPCGPALLNT